MATEFKQFMKQLWQHFFRRQYHGFGCGIVLLYATVIFPNLFDCRKHHHPVTDQR